MMSFEYFQNKKIAILWYGREGKSSLQFLLKIGISPKNITILDGAKKIEWLAANFEHLSKIFGIEPEFNMTFGDTYLDNLKKFDIIIKTPGISLYHEKIYPYRHKLSSQAQIFFDYYQGKILAVTGTKGKSTTSTLIYETIKNAKKKVQLIGNIGNPVLDYLNIENVKSQEDEYVVFEVSSYMLEWLKKKNYISILLNIYPDHLDWHNGFDNYQKAKFNIIYGSEHNLIRYEILNKNDLDSDDFKEYNARIFGRSGEYVYTLWNFFAHNHKIFDDKEILLKGEHNMMNICSVIGVCDIMNIDYKIFEETLKTFHWLPHRMEIVGTYWWITRIDDAISTTPESTIQAIKTFGKQIDTIFLGGTDRGYIFDDLIACIREYGIRNVVLFPDSGKRIAQAIKDDETQLGKDIVRIHMFQTNDMKEAVKFAYKYTKHEGICLLSTASPSYSLRKNFEEKWNLFKKYIQELV